MMFLLSKPMKRAMCFFLLVLLVCSLSNVYAEAASSFFAGKTIRIIVGASPGGGYDTVARLIARHLSRHIPGNPAVVVQNMPGAASAVAFNYVYSRAQADGLTWLTADGTLILSRIIGLPGPDFDVEKYPWLGVAQGSNIVCMVMNRTGITTTEQFLHSDKPIRLAATSRSGDVYVIPRIAGQAMDSNFKIIVGYDGTTNMRMAMQAGEADAACWSWESIKVKSADMLARKEAVPILQLTHARHPELPGVPWIFDYQISEDFEAMLKLVIGPGVLSKLYAVPPGTPLDRLKILRQAFADTLRDTKLLAEAEKMKIPISYKSPEEVASVIRAMMATPPDLKKAVLNIVRPR